MLRPYKFLLSPHVMLHNYLLDFFDRIEIETKAFDQSLFDPEFYPIATRHSTILLKQCRLIYASFQKLSTQKRRLICNQIRISNNVVAISEGRIKPVKLDKDVQGVEKLIRTLFLKSYDQVLDGDPFKETFNVSLRKYYTDFGKKNKEITICPICGIVPLKKGEGKARDQFDHYLPKALYPLSAVNMDNLVPICTDCNSNGGKGEKDVMHYAKNGKFFFAYDEVCGGIEVRVSIIEDNPKLEEIKWQIEYVNPHGKLDEVESWKVIYDIEDRHVNHIKPRIEGWYKTYWQHMRNTALADLTDDQKKRSFLSVITQDYTEGFDVLRKPSLDAFLSQSKDGVEALRSSLV